MELSNYQAFMECMRKWEKIGCNILCGLALWEQMQDCDRRGVPYTDIDIEAVSQDVAYRLMMSHDRLYALALYENHIVCICGQRYFRCRSRRKRLQFSYTQQFNMILWRYEYGIFQ